jgi:hypothetical protein
VLHADHVKTVMAPGLEALDQRQGTGSRILASSDCDKQPADPIVRSGTPVILFGRRSRKRTFLNFCPGLPAPEYPGVRILDSRLPSWFARRLTSEMLLMAAFTPRREALQRTLSATLGDGSQSKGASCRGAS